MRWEFCWALCGDTSIAFCDTNISAVDKCLLFSFSYPAISWSIAAPTVGHSPPPLQYAVIASQTFGELEPDLEDRIFLSVDFKLCSSIGLSQYVLQFLLCYWRLTDISNSKSEVSQMVGRHVYQHLDLFALFIVLGDGASSKFPRLDVQNLSFLKMVRITTHSTLSLVSVPLHAESAVVQLIIGILPRCLKTVPPSGVTACWIYNAAVAQNEIDPT